MHGVHTKGQERSPYCIPIAQPLQTQHDLYEEAIRTTDRKWSSSPGHVIAGIWVSSMWVIPRDQPDLSGNGNQIAILKHSCPHSDESDNQHFLVGNIINY